MKRPTMLSKAILHQAEMDLGVPVERDVQTLEHRIEHEGLSFLTITLPLLSDALERGLEEGRFNCPTAFHRQMKNGVTGRLPRFLGGFFNRVFTFDGYLQQDTDAEYIYYIRQICRFFKKLKILCSEDRMVQAENRFIEVEKELFHATEDMARQDPYLDAVSNIWFDVFEETDPSHFNFRHGPGATAERLLPNERRRIRKWYDRFDHLYPADLLAYPNYGFAVDQTENGGASDSLQYLSVSEETPVRVVFVPKTMTAPRVIAIEPSCMQFVQQGALDYIVKRLESHPATMNSIRFKDQEHNVERARVSSQDRSLSTIDLKEASDRVHLDLVRRIFKGTAILDILESSRSLSADLPSGRNVILSKYASMGSALCFPVEAMVFYTIIIAAMLEHDKKEVKYSTISSYAREVDVYGDDIIIPVRYTGCVVRKLESYKLLVNVNKSFTKSLFRESFGGDFYDGTSVKPIYAREVPPDLRRHWTPNHVMSWVATANLFYSEGKWLIAQAIRDMVDSMTNKPIPVSSILTGDGLYFCSVFQTRNLRFNRRLQGWEQRRLVYQPSKQEDDISGDLVAILNTVWGCSPNSKYYNKESTCPKSRENLQLSETTSRVTVAHGGDHPHQNFELSLRHRKSKTSPYVQLMQSHVSIETAVPKTKTFGTSRIAGSHTESLSSLKNSERLLKLQAKPLPLTDFVSSYSGLTTVGARSESADIRHSDTFSTKRGGFIPKHRWVTLIT